MEIIPIVDPASEKIVIKGFAERNWSEGQGLTHLTVIIIAVRSDRCVQVQIRNCDKRTYAGCRDFMGGHVTFGADFFTSMFGAQLNIESVILDAAVREANEELHLHSLPQHQPLIIERHHLVQVGNIGEFVCNLPQNKERSTVYLFPIPHNMALAPMDDEKGEFAPVESDFLNFRELCEAYQTHRQDAVVARNAKYDFNKSNWQIADGAGRILSDANLARKVADAIDRLSDDAFQGFQL